MSTQSAVMFAIACHEDDNSLSFFDPSCIQIMKHVFAGDNAFLSTTVASTQIRITYQGT